MSYPEPRWALNRTKEGISTIDEANGWIDTSVEQYNARFAKPPRLPHDVHRPVQPFENLEHMFPWEEPRTLSQPLSLQYDKVL